MAKFDFRWFKNAIHGKGGIWEEPCVWFAELPTKYIAIYRPNEEYASDDDQVLVYNRLTGMWQAIDAAEMRLKLTELCAMPPRELNQGELRKQILEILADPSVFPYWDSKDEKKHEFIYELMADYRDYISDSTVSKILDENKCGDYFCSFLEEIDEWWQEPRWTHEEDIVSTVTAELEKKEQYADGFSAEEESMIHDIVLDYVIVQVPYDHYLNQEVCANIFVDTGDGNFDYTLNHVYPAYDGDSDKEPDDAAGVVWLAQQQGYSKEQLWKELQEGDMKEPKGFLQSLRVEVANEGSHMQCLTFLVRMPLRELIHLNQYIQMQDRNGHFFDNRENPDCGMIVLAQKTECGLYDPWNGGGSLLEIQLEKDVELPIRFIRSAMPDGGDGYAIQKVYGTTTSPWRRNTVKSIAGPETTVQGK